MPIPARPEAARRLSPDVRKAGILRAALAFLDREGLQAFSLEAVAREAGVAATLPRHYFGGTDSLLTAATIDVLSDVERSLLDGAAGRTLVSRMQGYLDILSQHPWSHSLWMRAAESHPGIDRTVAKARRRMVESIYRRPWRLLSKPEQIDGFGRVGYVEAVVSDWIRHGMKHRDLVLSALVSVVGRVSELPEQLEQ